MTHPIDALVVGPGSRPTDPWTSAEAARQCKANDCRLVLSAHAEHPQGLTDFELADLVKRQQTSAGKRRGELRDYGFIESAGYARPAPSGRPAMVWKITSAGFKVLGLPEQEAANETQQDRQGEAA